MSDATWPRLKLGSHLVAGLAAVALFVVMVLVILGSGFSDPAGFESGVNVTAAIGYAMFDLTLGDVPSEGFLAALLMVAVVLDAALDGALLLAKREEGGSLVAALTDGGRPADEGSPATGDESDAADDRRTNAEPPRSETADDGGDR